MVEHKLIENGNVVVIKKDDKEFQLLASELASVFSDWERFAIFRRQVIDKVKELVKAGELPEEAITNDDFIDDVIREYEKMKGDTYDEVQIKLDLAFAEVAYDDYV